MDMKTLDKNEWIAVIVSIFVVGFFFVFGASLVSIFSKKTPGNVVARQPQVSTQDQVIGTGDLAEPGNNIVIDYVGHLSDGKIFDSTIARNEPYKFILGVGQVKKGLDQGIAGMRVGGKRIITVPPELGYGASDYGSIPGGSTLTFEVELLKVEK